MGIGKTVAVETVDPAQARAWLSKQNRFNRPIKKPTVTKYADEMRRDGGWVDNGVPLVFDEAGHLLDGQHRLLAVVESGQPREFLIVRGVSTYAFTTFDIGARRSFGDILAIEGYMDSSSLAGVVKAAWTILTFGIPGPGHSDRQPSHDELLKLIGVRRSLIDANAYSRTEAFRSIAVHRPDLAVAYDIAIQSSPDDATFFFDHLVSGADLSATSPILLLRNRLIQFRTDPQGRTPDGKTIWAITAKAWNAFQGGEEIKLLAWRRGGSKPESMPQFEGLEKWVAAINETL